MIGNGSWDEPMSSHEDCASWVEVRDLREQVKKLREALDKIGSGECISGDECRSFARKVLKENP